MPLQNNFTPICTVCKKPMGLVSGKAIHYLDKSKHKDQYYVCMLCNTEIRCYPGTIKPMGRPADGTLKEERRWVGVKLDAMIKAKMRRDSVTEDVARVAAWGWVSRLVSKDVEFVEGLDVPEMGVLVPALRKIE